VGDYVNGFSLVLGVYMFGLQGVLLGPALVCFGKLLYELGGSIIHEAEGLVTPMHDVHIHEPSLPPHQRQQRYGGTGRAYTRQPKTFERSDPARATNSDYMSKKARGASEQQLEKWSKDIEYRVSQTMRRLSFLSPFGGGSGVSSALARPAASSGPAAAPTVVTPCIVSTRHDELGRTCGLDRSPDSTMGRNNGSPRSNYAPHVRSHRSTVDPTTRIWAVVSIEGGEYVRVTVPAGSLWPDFLNQVSARLRNIGAVPAAETDSMRVVALRDAHGNLVANVDDLRCGERLLAIASSGHSASDDSEGNDGVCGIDGVFVGAGQNLNCGRRAASSHATNDTLLQEATKHCNMFSTPCATHESSIPIGNLRSPARTLKISE
jgi:hypothetical protein